MKIPETKRFIPKGFELGTTLSQPNRSVTLQKCRCQNQQPCNTCTLKKLRLTFNGHIASLTSSLLPTFVPINGVRHLFAKDVLYMYIIQNSLVFSKLFYCSTVQSGTSKENIHKLQLMQNFAGRILCNTQKFDHITPVLHELVWLTT